jgi:hypothetical protein
MVELYLVTVAIAAVIAGFNTRNNDISRQTTLFLMACSLAWPLLLLLALGSTFRRYSVSRLAEDAADAS